MSRPTRVRGTSSRMRRANDGLYPKLERIDGLRSMAGNLSLKLTQDSRRSRKCLRPQVDRGINFNLRDPRASISTKRRKRPCAKSILQLQVKRCAPPKPMKWLLKVM